MKKIPEKVVKEMIKLREQGIAIPKIASRLGVSPSTLKSYTKDVRLKVYKNNGGRPKKLSNDMKKELVANFKKNEIKYLNDGRGKLFDKYGIKVCKQTIKNYLNEDGLKCYTKQKKPFLTEKHKEKRLNFAETFFNFSYFEWCKIIWSDEKKFCLLNSNHKEYYWKKPDDRPEDHHTQKTKKFGGGSIMIWGCFTCKGVGELVKIDGIMDSIKYINVLSHGLIPSIERSGLDYREVTFMQDNDPKHTSKLTREWLNKNKINVLDWPAQSPDMNPIENLWNQIEQRIWRRVKQPTNVEELWEAVKLEWSKIDNERIRNLYLSMNNRVRELREVKGGHTKY